MGKDFVYKRKINYYETDKMGVVHHSNYIRFLEETRCNWMEQLGMPFESFEAQGLTIPVLGVNIEYKHHVSFGDTILIHPYIQEYSGVRLVVGYDVTDERTGKTVIVAETKHCFTNANLRPVNLKKAQPDFSDKFQSLLPDDLD